MESLMECIVFPFGDCMDIVNVTGHLSDQYFAC